jgi:hypothetical protein
MLLFFTFGAFAVALAQDLPSSVPAHTVELHRLLKNGRAQLDAHALTLGLGYESWNIPNTPPPNLEMHRSSHARVGAPLRPSLAPSYQVHAPKVSLQILQSVLII